MQNITPWSPSYVANAVVLDAGGLQIDAFNGGLFRLRGLGGGVRDTVDLGPGGLVFAGDTELTSPSDGILAADGVPLSLATHTHVVPAGPAFPGVKATGDRWFRTDLGMEFFWDGTRWLSTQMFSTGNMAVGSGSAPVQPYTASAAVGSLRVGIDSIGGSDIWLDHVFASVTVAGGGTALSASHKWVVTFTSQPANAAMGGTINIDSGASSVWRKFSTSIGALFTGNFHIDLSATKTGTPGNLYIFPQFFYRIVAT